MRSRGENSPSITRASADRVEGDELVSLLSPWGLGLGFGTRYDFNEHFAVFAELAFKMYFTGSDMDKTYNQDNIYYSEAPDQWRNEWEHKLSVPVKLISSALGLRFTF
ncbi:MAG: hypothetical protein GF331_19245 [Chitinivibrionales bacterium]|nr:hypothetical protein [Chitinivibrionales bacterium]